MGNEFAKIEELALHDPTVRHLLTLYRNGDMTREDMLIAMVVVSVEQKNHYIQACIDLQQRS